MMKEYIAIFKDKKGNILDIYNFVDVNIYSAHFFVKLNFKKISPSSSYSYEIKEKEGK